MLRRRLPRAGFEPFLEQEKDGVGDIFQEVDEEVRRDRFETLWKTYGGYAIAVVVAIVLGTSASVGWRAYQEMRQQEDSEKFNAAVQLMGTGKFADAADRLRDFAAEAGSGYAMIGRFREAVARAEAGDRAAAVRIYESLAADSGLETLYRDLASLLAVMQQIDEGDPEALRGRLTTLMAADGAWRHTARELSGMLALRVGDQGLAKAEFKTLVDDLEAPSGARARAAEVLRALGG